MNKGSIPVAQHWLESRVDTQMGFGQQNKSVIQSCPTEISPFVDVVILCRKKKMLVYLCLFSQRISEKQKIKRNVFHFAQKCN